MTVAVIRANAPFGNRRRSGISEDPRGSDVRAVVFGDRCDWLSGAYAAAWRNGYGRLQAFAFLTRPLLTTAMRDSGW